MMGKGTHRVIKEHCYRRPKINPQEINLAVGLKQQSGEGKIQRKLQLTMRGRGRREEIWKYSILKQLKRGGPSVQDRGSSKGGRGGKGNLRYMYTEDACSNVFYLTSINYVMGVNIF